MENMMLTAEDHPGRAKFAEGLKWLFSWIYAENQEEASEFCEKASGCMVTSGRLEYPAAFRAQAVFEYLYAQMFRPTVYLDADFVESSMLAFMFRYVKAVDRDLVGPLFSEHFLYENYNNRLDRLAALLLCFEMCPESDVPFYQGLLASEQLPRCCCDVEVAGSLLLKCVQDSDRLAMFCLYKLSKTSASNWIPAVGTSYFEVLRSSSSEFNFPEANRTLALCYLTGTDVEANDSNALEAMIAFIGGVLMGNYSIPRLLEDHLYSIRFDQAKMTAFAKYLIWLEYDPKTPEYDGILENTFFRGHRITADPLKAAIWLQEAAVEGDAMALSVIESNPIYAGFRTCLATQRFPLL